MERKYYVYVWYRKDDKKPFYVGKGFGNRLNFLQGRNKYFMNVLKKHGGYPLKIVENLTEKEALEKEIELIKEYRELYPLTNITNGGDGTSGLKHSLETRKNISELAKIQWSNPEMRKILSESRKKTHGNPEFRRKVSERCKGKKLTNEHILNIKNSMNRPEITKKLAQAKMKYTNVICLNKANNEQVKVFENTKEAVKWLETLGYKNPNMSSVIGCISGKNKTSYGFKWIATKIEESS